ncbi:MAG: hypothetical protein JO163_20300, partial [Methylobacteriaceae bacterium]|nr:hypothetical protein [Methylobacteriaceae bacterium]
MSVLITSGGRLGLRALGSGGRIAVSSYDQIARTLRDTLGPEHAALFAEPSVRGGTTDWFADVDTEAKPVRLADAPPQLREAGRERLERLFAAISAKAATLQKSDREADRILGEIINFALEIPDESCVWLVGNQPVLCFWGHVRDHGQPSESPILTIVRRPAQVPVAAAAPEPPSLPPPPPPAAVPVVATLGPSESPPARALFTIPRGVLWAIFAALLVAIGVMLLRACALGLPRALTGWFLNFCPATIDSGLLAALNDEKSRQATLQAQYEELLREAQLKR